MQQSSERRQHALLVGLERPSRHSDGWSAQESLDELERLVDTAGGTIAGKEVQSRNTPDVATWVGSGKAQEIEELRRHLEFDLVVFNTQLSPTQQRNLQEIIACPVLDRTTVILDIFAQRARTREARLQVELAQLNFRLPRLAGKGVALSRLGGGIGTRGPGETKLEVDRRRIRERISTLGQDLEEIRAELQEQGYIGEKKARRAAPPKGDTGRADKAAPPLTVLSSDGLEIWVGRNNRQNDYLTLKLAAPMDLWLHTKEIPGSHVILRVPPGREVPERALHEAAALAAYHSRGRDSAAVPVDYTARKHVRKPSGAKPGMVIYEHQKTLWVTPDPELNPILKRHLGGGDAGESGGAAGASDTGHHSPS